MGYDCHQMQNGSEPNELNTRRWFLQQATTFTFGALTLTLLPASLAEDDPSPYAPGPNAAGDKPLFGFLVDTEKCIGSGKCLSACRSENDVPAGFHRTWVERYVHFKDGRVQVDLVSESGCSGLPIIDPETVARSYFVPKLCNHCKEAPCNQVCPVHASFTSPEGVELIDKERCIGCAYCIQACPYGARYINPQTNTADKCTWCYHRVMRGEQPACVEACPVGARIFGRLDDPTSEICKRIAEIPTHALKSHLGTQPKTRYVGISDEVI